MSTTFILCIYIENVSNQQWFSVVSTLNCNDICHHSSQNVVDSWGAVSESNKFWALWWQMLLLIRVRSTVNHCWFVFYPQYWHQVKYFFQCMIKIISGWHEQHCLHVLLSKNWLIVLQHCQETWGNIKTNNTHDWLTMQAGGRIVKIQFNLKQTYIYNGFFCLSHVWNNSICQHQ